MQLKTRITIALIIFLVLSATLIFIHKDLGINEEAKKEVLNGSVTMTKEDIVELYTKLKKEYLELEVLNITLFKGEKSDYALVEVKYSDDSLVGRFELVNLNEEGKREVIPNVSESTLMEIINENYLIFLASGLYPDGSRDFPYIARFIRIKNDEALNLIGENFIAVRDKKYYRIKEQTTFGRIQSGTAHISKVMPTLEGLQVLYKLDFLAGGTTNPKTSVHFDEDNNLLIFEIENSSIMKNEVPTKIMTEKNKYMSSITIEEIGNKCIISIKMRNENVKYTIETDLLYADSPFFELKFR